jgi:hypothetical protein
MSFSERCNDIERENLFSKISEKISLVFYQKMKHKWHSILNSNSVLKNGLVWIKAGVLKLRGIRRKLEKGTCPLCRGNEDVKQIYIVELPRNKKKKKDDGISE